MENFTFDVAEAYGLEFEVFSADDGVGKCLRDYGEFARPELELIIELCDGDFIDVGANVGAICLPFADIRPERQVVAIEALPEVAAALERNVARNRIPNVKIVRAVAGDSEMAVSIPTLDASIMSNVGAASLYRSSSTKSTAQMVRIDDQRPSSTRFVKIDVEGFEPRVLAGAPILLNTIRPSWLVEVSRARPKAAAAAKAALVDAGYDLYWFFSPFLTRKRPRLLEVEPEMRGDVSILAIDGRPPWDVISVGDEWPNDVADFPYLIERYGFVSAR